MPRPCSVVCFMRKGYHIFAIKSTENCSFHILNMDFYIISHFCAAFQLVFHQVYGEYYSERMQILTTREAARTFSCIKPAPCIQKAPPPQRKRLLLKWCDSIDKPSSVVYDHLSSPAVADGVKPPFNEARRADALSSAPIGVASGRVYTAAQSPALRWALTPPFHPYRLAAAVSFLLHLP